MVVILGLWVGIIGYGVLYTGVQKLAGDGKYSLRKAFTGVAPAASSGTQAKTVSASSPAADQSSIISSNPILDRSSGTQTV